LTFCLGVFCQSTEDFRQLNLFSSPINSSNTCAIKPQTYIVVSKATERLKQNLIAVAAQVSSGEDVEDLLNDVDWKLFIYTCGKPHLCNDLSDTNYTPQNDCLLNTSCCFSNRSEAIYFFTPKCDTQNCTDFLQSSVITKWYIFFILGILCLLGNFIVIFQKITNLRKGQTQHKSLRIYNILVLNLALADMIMGIYLIIISLEIRRKVANDIYFSDHGLCHALGVLNAVSTQVSLCVLLIISSYHLVGLTSPYKRLHVKVVVAVLCGTWLIWLVVALLPAIPSEPLATKFTIGVRDERFTVNNYIDFIDAEKLLQNLTSSLNYNLFEVNFILKSIQKYPTRSVLRKAFDQFGLINLVTENWSYVNYYDIQYTCATNYFTVDQEYFRPVDYLTLFYIVFNLMVSIVIVIIYLLVTILVSRNKIEPCTFALMCKCLTNQNPARRNNSVHTSTNAVRKSENQKIYKRISFIILTDLAFMFPLCITGLVIFAMPPTTQSPTDVLKSLIKVETVQLFLIPFNSILNPFIYSFHLWKNMIKKFTKK